MLVSGITPVSNLGGIQATTVEAAVSKKQTAKFVRAVDGDTAKLSIKGTTYTFRFLAIDTPETVKPNTPPAFMVKKHLTTLNALNQLQLLLELIFLVLGFLSHFFLNIVI